MPRPAPPRSDLAVPDIPEPRRIRTQLDQPSLSYPAGRIAEGWYMVRGGMLHVEDMEGRLLGRLPVKPGDNIEAAARKILLEKTRGSDFWAPIKYH